MAGKREGLAGERSGLFMEQVRLTKELREQDAKANGHLGMDVMPRYSVWENVTGALSSNNGEDFRAVLEETARIAEEGVSIPGLEKGQKWSNAGAICGDGWSIAWRVHDAQYWGVPQRRKRVCVLADFNGHTAADILFECFRETSSDDTYEVIGNTGRQPRSEIYAFRESVSGNPSQSEREGQEVAGSVGESSDSASYTLKIRGGVEIDSYGKRAGKGALVQTELSGTLGVSQDQTLFDGTYQQTTGCLTQGAHPGSYNGQDAYNDMLVTQMVCLEGKSVSGFDSYNQTVEKELAQPLRSAAGGDTSPKVVCLEGNGYRPSHRGDGYKESDIQYTLNSTEQHGVCYGLDRASFNQGKNAKYDFSVQEEISQPLVARGPGGGIHETIGSLCARDYKGVGSQYVKEGKVIVQKDRTSSNE